MAKTKDVAVEEATEKAAPAKKVAKKVTARSKIALWI